MNDTILPELKQGSTWKLFFLGIITFAVYFAHYIKKQTAIINAHSAEEERISDRFITFILAISYLSLALLVPYLFLDETHPLSALSNLVDFVNNVAFLVWGFKARTRMNNILSAQPGQPGWFHGLWTFLFTPLYFNYKINCLT